MTQVTSVDYIYNATLKELFSKKKEEFQKLRIPHEETFVFHKATADASEKIALGQGFEALIEVYKAFTPEPDVTQHKSVLLCLALLGNRGWDYGQFMSERIILRSGPQLLPMYLVHYDVLDK